MNFKRGVALVLAIVMATTSINMPVYAKQQGNDNNISENQGDYEFKVNSGGNGNVSIDTGYYNEGDVIDFYVIPDKGYIVNNINVSKGEVTRKGLFKYSYTMPDKKAVLSVTFKKFDVNDINIDNIDFEEFTKDTDGDGLSDYLELEKFNTDPNLIDTDGDMLTDYEEVTLTGTDPNMVDTDGNGFTDANEDADGDKLTNIEEIHLETDPMNIDTDFDELNDYEEVHIYSTNPLDLDTDRDGIQDATELEYKIDPTKEDTDGDGILDGDESFEVTKDYSDNFEDVTVTPSLDVELEGDQIDTLQVYKASENDVYTSEEIPGFIGNAYDFRVGDDIENGILTFDIAPELRASGDVEYAIYEVDKINQEMILLENQTYDSDTNTISAPIDTLSNKTYMVLNKTDFDEEFEIEIAVPDESIAGADMDIVFAIDSSGSMGSNDPYDIRKDVTKDFIDILEEDDRVGLVDFDSTAYVRSYLTYDKESVKSQVDKIDSSGGTNLSEAMSKSIYVHNYATSSEVPIQSDELLTEVEITQSEEGESGLNTDGTPVKVDTEQNKEIHSDESEKDRAKFIILLTDGEGSYNSIYTQQAIDNNIRIYTVGLGSDVNESLLQSIARETKGNYYHADNAEDLITEFENMQDEIISMTTNSDTDSLSDYHEKYMRIFNGSYINTDPYNGDTDGDGLSDSDEIEPVYTADGKSIKNFKVKSNPTNPDTDSDGLRDDVDDEPIAYNVTGKTLANVAHISYANLEKYIGMTIEDVLNSGRHIPSELKEDFVEETLSSATIIDANNSRIIGYEINDWGLGSVALRIPVVGADDIVIYGLRGTEPFDVMLEDVITDIWLTVGFDTIQSKEAYRQYKQLPIKPTDDVYLTGHSLGGRLVLDTLYKIYENGGVKPTYSATFNGLGYNKIDCALLDNDVIAEYDDKLTNYFIISDIVGNGLGDGIFFTRPGLNKSFDYYAIRPHTIKIFTSDKLGEDFTYYSSKDFDRKVDER